MFDSAYLIEISLPFRSLSPKPDIKPNSNPELDPIPLNK